MMPHSSEFALPVIGGSTATTIRSSSSSAARRLRRVEHRPGPERALDVEDELAVELLPPEPLAAVLRGHRLEEARRQVHAVRRGRRPRHHRARRRRGARAAAGSPAASSSPAPAAVRRAGARTAACPRPPRPSSTWRARRTRRSRTAARAATPGRSPRRSAPPPRSARPAACGWPATRAGGRAARRRRMPDVPNTITSRAWSIVSPTRATRELRPRVARLAPLDLRADPFGPGAGLACPPAAQDDPGRPVSLGRQLMSLDRPVLEEPGQGHQGIRCQRSRGTPSRSPSGTPDSKSRNDLGTCCIEVELDARPVGFASLDKTCLGFENRPQRAVVRLQRLLRLPCSRRRRRFPLSDA